MRFGKATLAAMLAVSMTSTPVLAQANSASSLSVAQRAGAEAADANQLNGGFFIPLIAVALVILGILAAIDEGPRRPRSP